MHPTFTLAHVVREPLTPSEGLPPLLILAHGYGSNEDNLVGLADYLDDRFFVVSVRAPISMGGGANAWYPLNFDPNGIQHSPIDAARGREALEKAVDELMAAYDIDPAQVYLAGFSQGGIMSLAVGLNQPEKIAGVVVMSGLLLPEIEPSTESQRTLPVFAAHGKWDEVIPVEMGREMVKRLETHPVDVTYREYPMGHQVSAESLADIDAWLKARLALR